MLYVSLLVQRLLSSKGIKIKIKRLAVCQEQLVGSIPRLHWSAELTNCSMYSSRQLRFISSRIDFVRKIWAVLTVCKNKRPDCQILETDMRDVKDCSGEEPYFVTRCPLHKESFSLRKSSIRTSPRSEAGLHQGNWPQCRQCQFHVIRPSYTSFALTMGSAVSVETPELFQPENGRKPKSEIEQSEWTQSPTLDNGTFVYFIFVNYQFRVNRLLTTSVV
jgi:hypothetical protein